MEFTPIETQEAFDQAVSERITRETSKYSDYDQIRSELETLKSKPDSFEEKKTEFETQIRGEYADYETLKTENAEFKADALRTKVILEAGLPVAMKDRLKGDDEASLKADAEALKKLLPPSAPKVPPRKKPEDGDNKSKLAEVANELRSR